MAGVGQLGPRHLRQRLYRYPKDMKGAMRPHHLTRVKMKHIIQLKMQGGGGDIEAVGTEAEPVRPAEEAGRLKYIP